MSTQEVEPRCADGCTIEEIIVAMENLAQGLLGAVEPSDYYSELLKRAVMIADASWAVLWLPHENGAWQSVAEHGCVPGGLVPRASFGEGDPFSALPEQGVLELPLGPSGELLGILCLGLGGEAALAPARRGLLRCLTSSLGLTLARAVEQRSRQDSEMKWRRVFETIPDALCISRERDGVLLDVNAGFTAISGFSREEVLGRRSLHDGVDLWYSEADREHLLRELRATGQANSIETRFKHRDGHLVVGLLSARYLDFPGERCILSATHDITELRHAQDQLARSEHRYRELVESIQEVIFSVDSQGVIEFISQGVRQYGYEPQELIGRPFAQFVVPDDLPGLMASFDDTLAGRIQPYEYRLLDAQGHPRPTRSLSRLALRDGKPVGLRGILWDLSAQRAIEEQLRSAQKMEAVGRLAAGLAHDFNNILSVVLSYSGFLADSFEAGDPRLDDVSEIQQAGKRGATLTRQLLAFSRKQVLRPVVVDLNRLVLDMEKLLLRLLGEDIDLALKVTAEPIWVRVDPGQMEQVILSLAIRARESMPGGGMLTIELSERELGAWESFFLGSVPPGRYALLDLCDTGVAIELSRLHSVFDPYGGRAGADSPIGLGLAGVYGFIRQSGGAMEAQAHQGKGNNFKVMLPLADTLALQPERPEIELDAQGRTVLVIEDDTPVMDSIARILSGAGFRVLTARVPSLALELLKAEPARVDVAIIDVILPEMSGTELASRLAAMGSKARVLFISGYAEGAIRRHGVMDSNMHFLSKPFSPRELLRSVQGLLDLPSADSHALSEDQK